MTDRAVRHGAIGVLFVKSGSGTPVALGFESTCLVINGEMGRDAVAIEFLRWSSDGHDTMFARTDRKEWLIRSGQVPDDWLRGVKHAGAVPAGRVWLWFGILAAIAFGIALAARA